MAGPWTAESFPQFEAAIRRLTEQHRELVDEPLHLAVSYLPAIRDQQHVYLPGATQSILFGTPSANGHTRRRKACFHRPKSNSFGL
jgi:hypothetical protein